MVKNRPTIADVAREAGVSKGLVSFALNDRPGVAAATRERILRVADEVGWVPSVRARSLSTDHSFALGLVIARDPQILSGDPFFPEVIAGVETALAEVEYALVLSMVGSEQAEIASYRKLAAHSRVDGVILTDLRRDDPRVALVGELGLPAVTLGHPDVPSGIPAVVLDDTPGLRAVVAHLADLGHTRIAHVAGPGAMLHGERRARSFAAALAELGLPPGTVVETDFTAADGARATHDLLADASTGAARPATDRPTAIVYANDPMAIAGLGVAQRLGIDVPRELSITGFDGSDVGAYLHPALTTVTTAAGDWGRAAAGLLLRVVDSPATPAADIVLDPATLVIRDSTAPPSA